MSNTVGQIDVSGFDHTIAPLPQETLECIGATDELISEYTADLIGTFGIPPTPDEQIREDMEWIYQAELKMNSLIQERSVKLSATIPQDVRDTQNVIREEMERRISELVTPEMNQAGTDVLTEYTPLIDNLFEQIQKTRADVEKFFSENNLVDVSSEHYRAALSEGKRSTKIENVQIAAKSAEEKIMTYFDMMVQLQMTIEAKHVKIIAESVRQIVLAAITKGVNKFSISALKIKE